MLHHKNWTPFQLSKRIDAFKLSMNPLGNLGIKISADNDRRRLCNHHTNCTHDLFYANWNQYRTDAINDTKRRKI